MVFLPCLTSEDIFLNEKCCLASQTVKWTKSQMDYDIHLLSLEVKQKKSHGFSKAQRRKKNYVNNGQLHLWTPFVTNIFIWRHNLESNQADVCWWVMMSLWFFGCGLWLTCKCFCNIQNLVCRQQFINSELDKREI